MMTTRELCISQLRDNYSMPDIMVSWKPQLQFASLLWGVHHEIRVGQGFPIVARCSAKVVPRVTYSIDFLVPVLATKS